MKKKNFRSLELVVRKYVQTYFSGNHQTLFQDSLIEVDVVREYQPGDKKLDSKSSLKIGKTMSRVFNPERALNVFVVLDLSSSLFSNLDQLIITALYLCYIAEINNEKIGLCVFSDKVLYLVQPTEDYSSVVASLEKTYNSFEPGKTTKVEPAFKAISEVISGNSFVFLISDFYYPFSSGFYGSIKRLASVNTNTFVSICFNDKKNWINVDLPFSMSFEDIESGEIIDFDLRKSLDYNSWYSDLKRNLYQAGSEVVFINPDDERYLLPLVKYLIRT